MTKEEVMRVQGISVMRNCRGDSDEQIRKMVGNSMSVKLVEAILNQILRCLRGIALTDEPLPAVVPTEEKKDWLLSVKKKKKRSCLIPGEKPSGKKL